MSGGNANVYFKLSDKSNDALGYIIFFGFYLFNLHPVKNPFRFDSIYLYVNSFIDYI